MFFHDKPGWGIALRIVLVLLLIGGMVWITKVAFYRGVAAGAGNMGPGFMSFSGDDDLMGFHFQDGYMDWHGKSGEMFFHHPGTSRSFSRYAGPMGLHPGFAGPMGNYWGASHATGFFHLLFGVLGFFLLLKLIFGFSGMGMYRHGPMGWGPGGRPYHHGHYYHHRCRCPHCSGEHDEDQAPEKAQEGKPKKKAS